MFDRGPIIFSRMIGRSGHHLTQNPDRKYRSWYHSSQRLQRIWCFVDDDLAAAHEHEGRKAFKRRFTRSTFEVRSTWYVFAKSEVLTFRGFCNLSWGFSADKVKLSSASPLTRLASPRPTTPPACSPAGFRRFVPCLLHVLPPLSFGSVSLFFFFLVRVSRYHIISAIPFVDVIAVLIA